MKYPALLQIVQAHRVEQCGNKAANLARVKRLGLNSSDGHVLVVAAFNDNLARLGLKDRVSEVLKAPPENQYEAEDLREEIIRGGLSEALHNTISSFIEPSTTYAVRSSAVGEDGALSSFAGQFDTVLNCNTFEKVERAVCKVWASLLNQGALAYANRLGVAPAAMAVILQKQVNATASGVLFTRDPRDIDSEQMVIEYCDGLGEKLVSGQITPASGKIDRNDGTFVEELPAENASTWAPNAMGAASSLRYIGLALEKEFSCPQDIEFSIDEAGKIVVLQTRPITTLTENTLNVSWSNANIAENFPDPICPMLQSFVGRGYGAYFRSLAVAFGVPRARVTELGSRFDEIVRCHGGRLYYNLSNIHTLLYAVPGGRFLAQYFNTFTGAKGLTPPTRGRSTVVREIFELSRMPFRISHQYLTLSRRLKSFEAQIDAYAAESNLHDLNKRTPDELAVLLERFLEIRLTCWTPAALSDAAAMISYGMLGSLLKDMPDINENELLQGLPGLASAKPVEALWDLSEDLKQDAVAETIRSDPPDVVLELFQNGKLGQAGQKIQNYLQKWGFRSSGELSLIRPSPQEDPLPILRLLHAYQHAEDTGPAAKSARQAKVRRERTQAAIRSLGFGRRQLFRAVLWATQTSIGLRERARMKQALLYSRLRHVALAAGRYLVLQSALRQADDIFYLGLEEAVATLHGAVLPSDSIAQRRHEMIKNETWAPPDAFVLPIGESFELENASSPLTESENPDLLSGTPACAGRTRGTAVVVLEVSDIGIIEKDQILVTRQTDPGWAAVFFLVKGLVIERGGLLSHGAIIAREYGIPAVIGVNRATKSIRNGANIEVLGDVGKVRIHAD